MPTIAKTDSLKFGSMGPSGPPFDITKDDTAGNEFAQLARYIVVGGAGDVAIVGLDNKTGVMKNLLAGVQYRANARQVLSTGTTATGIQGYP